MNPEEASRWARVASGQEPFTWDLWGSALHNGERLTAAGHQVVDDALARLESFLGRSWPDRVLKHDPDVILGSGLGDVALPSIEWFLRTYAQVALWLHRPEARTLQKLMQRNLSSENWSHSLLELEVAGFARRDGLTVEFEPSLGSRQGDLMLRGRGDEPPLLVEITRIGMNVESIRASEYLDEVSIALMHLRVKHPDAYVTGHLGLPISDQRQFEQWMADVEAVVSATASDGRKREVRGPTGGVLTVSTAPPPAGTDTLSGSPTQSNEWERLAARLREKAMQTADVENVWLRIDDAGFLWYLGDWATAPLATKLASIAPLIQREILRYKNIAGVVLSHGWKWRFQDEPDEQWELPTGGMVAIRRTLPIGRFRETIFVLTHEDALPAMHKWVQWYATETTWLDWALEELGHPPLLDLIIDQRNTG